MGKLICTLILLAATAVNVNGSQPQIYTALISNDPAAQVKALQHIEDNWNIRWAPFLLETIFFDRESRVTFQILKLLKSKTGINFRYDFNAWYRWLWNQEFSPHPDYGDFKSHIYGQIDPPFGGYFGKDRKATIRLDEVRWGGVRQDGIPPLRYPKMVKAAEADYLAPADIVFGIEINGDARAYPKRILAWHEMFVDNVGGENVTGVYCTLCGAVILYNNKAGDTTHSLGTSGFLYRSNKLMYDQETQSLWNSIIGEPVIGPLVGKGIILERGSVVTTTWGEWQKRHPKSTVLSLETGFVRNYDEGVAYRKYFATDKLWYTVPKFDRRLLNKDEILGIIYHDTKEPPLAIFSGFLMKTPLYAVSYGKRNLIILTDKSGANRVYSSGSVHFTVWDRDEGLEDSTGISWKMHEAYLESQNGKRLSRQPAHRAFWFGWYSMFNNTRLIK